MLKRLVSFVTGLPGALWRATIGRLSASPSSSTPVPLADSPEPRSVAGITFRASLVIVGVVLASYLLYELRVLLIGVLALVLFLIFPPLIRQAVDFADDLPRIADDLRAGAIGLIDGIAGAGTGEDIVDSLTSGAQGALPELGSLLSVPLTVASILANTVVVVFLSALMLIERDRVRAWVMEFVEEQDRDAVMGVGRTALLRLGAYVRGQLLVMLIIGIGSGIGMVVLGVPFAVPLGALSFITAAIPLAGAFIAGGPIVLVALTVSPGTALLMAAWLVVLQQLEGSLITPYIQGKVVNLSAIAVVLGVFAGTSLAGIVGGIIAIPLVAVADVVVRDIVFPLRRRAEERRRHGVEAPGL
jgi:putative heme transporter